MSHLLVQSDARHIPLPDRSVHMCVTSPPYWGLRSYLPDGHGDKAAEIGLEATPELFVAGMVAVFREVWRVLRDDGTVWANMGDSYAGSTGVTSNVRDSLDRLMKGRPLVIGDAVTIRVTAHRGGVPLNDQRFPDGIFFPLLGVERVTIKQRNNDFCQVFHSLADPCYCWVGSSIHSVSRDVADLEIVLDPGNDVSIVITDHQPDGKAILAVPGIDAFSGKCRDRTLSVEEAGEPVSEAVRNGEAVGNPVSLDSPSKRLPDVYLVNDAVPLGDRLGLLPGPRGDFRVTQASPQEISLGSEDGRIHLRTSLVRHLFVSNEFGSLVHYHELYGEAIRKSNACRPKQELGIPEMVKMALMEDGWICRSTIIWAKPNPMPESVTDRPTKSHEYLFLLAKGERYFFDAEAVRQPHAAKTFTHRGGGGNGRPGQDPAGKVASGNWNDWDRPRMINPSGANLRSVWTIPTESFPGMHFATYPRKLIEPCIKAGTSERGVCPRCGAPWRRLMERSGYDGRRADASVYTGQAYSHAQSAPRGPRRDFGEPVRSTLGWSPGCTCDAGEPVPATILDPFAGSGTSLVVAEALGRRGIGLDLSAEYLGMARRRIERPHAAVARPGREERHPLFEGVE